MPRFAHNDERGFVEFVEISGDSLRLIEINGDRWKLAGRWRLESPHSNQDSPEPRYLKIFTPGVYSSAS